MPQRIRTIKPEFFQHEGIFDLEVQVGLPVRLCFVGLLTCCDREGRFKWRPRNLKTDILPYDEVDFGAVLTALETGGFVRQYAVDGEVYGYIPTFLRHQVINKREALSRIPAPPESSGYDSSSLTLVKTRSPECSCTHVQARGEVEVEVEAELEWERNGAGMPGHATTKCEHSTDQIFNPEQIVADLRNIWPRPDFGYASEHATMEAVEAEAKEAGLSTEEAAKSLLARVQQVAHLTEEWPRDRKHLIPGLTNLLRNRTYKQSDCFWEHRDDRQNKREEREQTLERIAHNVVTQTVEEGSRGMEKL